MTPLRTILAASIISLAPPAAANWVSACDDTHCLFRHNVDAPGGEGISALFEILVDAEAAEADIVLTTPLGVALESGVRFEIEGQEWTAPIKVCHADGCRATYEVDADTFVQLLQQKTLTIHYHVFGAAEDVALELPITGLVKAITSQNR